MRRASVSKRPAVGAPRLAAAISLWRPGSPAAAIGGPMPFVPRAAEAAASLAIASRRTSSRTA